MKPPTLLQLAKNSCANHQNNGTCLGCKINSDLKIPSCAPRPTCRLADDKPSHCVNFENCVLPEHPEVGKRYRQIVGLPPLVQKTCAECGQPRLRGKRFCSICAANRRTATYRTSKRRARKKSHGLSTFHAKNHPNSLAKEGGLEGGAKNPCRDSHHAQNAVPTVDTTRGAA